MNARKMFLVVALISAAVAGDLDLVDTLIGEIHAVRNAVDNQTRTASVLVNTSTDIEAGRGDVRDRTVSRSPDEHVAPPLVRSSLEPVDVLAVHGHRTEPQTGLSNGRSRQGGFPGSKRSGS